MDDPWGVDQLPATTATPPLPPGLAAHAEVVRTGIPLRTDEDHVDPEELPELQALVDAGWTALFDASVQYLVPAVGPSEHRCWAPDGTPAAYQCGRGTDTYDGWVRQQKTSDPMAWSRDEELADSLT